MKPLSFFVGTSLLLAACNAGSGTSATSKDTTASADTTGSSSVSYPYSIGYSADFTIGDPKHVQTVLTLWKDYDNNTLDAHKDAFADSIQFTTAEGSVMRGPRDSVIHALAAYRASLANAIDSVNVVVNLQPKGKEESWVCIWGEEIDTHKDNKVDSIYLQEDWMFDKNGKIARIEQYMQAPPKSK